MELKPIRVRIYPPLTEIYWSDGTKTSVKLDRESAFSEESGILWACAKKLLGNTSIVLGMIKEGIESEKEIVKE